MKGLSGEECSVVSTGKRETEEALFSKYPPPYWVSRHSFCFVGGARLSLREGWILDARGAPVPLESVCKVLNHLGMKK